MTLCIGFKRLIIRQPFSKGKPVLCGSFTIFIPVKIKVCSQSVFVFGWIKLCCGLLWLRVTCCGLGILLCCSSTSFCIRLSCLLFRRRSGCLRRSLCCRWHLRSGWRLNGVFKNLRDNVNRININGRLSCGGGVYVLRLSRSIACSSLMLYILCKSCLWSNKEGRNC